MTVKRYAMPSPLVEESEAIQILEAWVNESAEYWGSWKPSHSVTLGSLLNHWDCVVLPNPDQSDVAPPYVVRRVSAS